MSSIVENLNLNGSRMSSFSSSSSLELSSSDQSLAYCFAASSISSSPIPTALGNSTLDENKCWFVSTHSADFLQSEMILAANLSYGKDKEKKGILPIAKLLYKVE